MKRTVTTLALIAALMISGAHAQSAMAQKKTVTDKIIEIGNTDNRTMEYIDVLSNRIGGRLVGSNAYDNAVEWCASKFEEWGLEVWVQEAGEVPVGFNRGPWSGRMLGGDGMVLHFATSSYTVGTKGVQRGHVLKEPLTQAEFNSMKESLKGAWVLIGGENNGYPIDWTEKGDSIRNAAIAENLEIDRKNREARMKGETEI